MEQKRRQFSIEKIEPESGNKLYIGLAWNLCLTVFLASGGICALCAAWGTNHPFWIEIILVAAVVFVCCMLETRKQRREWIRLLYVAVPWLLVLILTGFRGYWTGARMWMNMILTQWNEAHEGGIMLLRVSENSAAISAFTLLAVVLIVQLSWRCVHGRKVICGAVYMAFWMAVTLAGSMFRPYMGMLLLIGLTGMFLAIQGGFITIRNLFTFCVVAGLVITGAFLVSQEEVLSVTAIRQQAKEQIHIWRYGEDSLPEGKLSEAAILHQSDDEMLRIQTEQQKMLYLRGFVGERYQDGNWYELSASVYGNENTGILKWLNQQGFEPMKQVAQYYSLCAEDQRPDTNRIRVSVADASRYYLYTPISLQRISGVTVKEKRAARLADSGLRGNLSYSETEVSPSRPSELTVAEDWVSNPQTDDQQTYCKAEAVYRDFVYENYTQTDEDTAVLMQKLFWKDYRPESDGIYSALTHVRTVLSQTVQYVEQPETAPEGVDPIQWFLTKSKAGNAVLYASAATEALRVYGIPARYVEGYYLSEEQSVMADGESLSVTGKNAHAWVEIYFDGIGWLPVDVTPGYYFDAVSLQKLVSAPDMVQKNVALNNTGYDTNTVKGSSQKTTQKMVKKVLDIAAICLGVVGLFLIFLTIVFLIVEIRRIILESMWKQYEKSFSDQERVKYKRKKLFHLLTIRDIDASLGWNTDQVDRLVAEQVVSVNPGEYRRVCVLLEKFEYGGQKLQKYEERTLDAFIEKLKKAEKTDRWKIRLKLRYDTLYDWKHFRGQRR